MKRVAFAFLLSIAAFQTFAQESLTGYNFLRLPVGAHAAALGGDNISIIEDDESFIFSNPALLSSVTDKTINFNFMSYMSGVNTSSAAFNRNIGERASWAVSGQYIDYGKMKQVDENNIQTGEFGARDIAMTGYFSYMLTDRIAGGIAAKFITSYIGDYNSIAMGVDLGLNYYDSDRDWSASFVVKNLGGQLKAYDNIYEHMPIDVQLGVSKRFLNAPLRLSATLVDLNHWDYKLLYHAVMGAELLLSDNIWVGAGYNFRRANEMKIINTKREESSHGAGWSLGAGLNLERFKLNLAYGKYHVSSNSITINVAYSL